MAKKSVDLLLLKTIENLGIVGDTVKVKPGFARNYLLPLGLAEAPTPSRIEALKEERAKAQAELEALRAAREELLDRMQSLEVTLIRSCNDQGVLYGSVTQRDISDALQEGGYDVSARSVRLPQPIRRVGNYDVPIQFEKDLRTEITVHIKPDEPLEEREELDFDEEGNLIEAQPAAEQKPETTETAEPAAEQPAST